MRNPDPKMIERGIHPDDLIVITGAGGFIAGALTRYFHNLGYTRIRAIDKKPLYEWYQHVPGVESLCLDVSEKENAVRAVEGAVEVYNLAADMGGMGFIETHRVECLRSILINTHMIESAYKAGAKRYFYSSSACAYNTLLQQDPNVRALKESDAYPAMAERGYGWEKLISEMFCQEYWEERGLETHIARFHNVYGPNGTWFGGREKAPAAISRKVIEALDKIRDHYNLDRLAQAACVAALRDRSYFGECIAKVRATRDWFFAELTKLGYDVIPSHGNFVFAAPPDKEE